MSLFFRSIARSVPSLLIAVLALGTVQLHPVAVLGQDSGESAKLKINWQKGPCTASLGTEASIRLPSGYKFAGAEDTRKLMEDMGNPVNGSEKGLVVPTNEDWFIVFEYSDVGYIKDDDKANLNANEILSAIKSGNEEGNKERRKRGWSTIEIVGWEQKPEYDSTTHNLVWAIRGKDQGDGGEVVNYNTRLLGRGGYMSANLVVEPEKLAKNVPAYKKLLEGFSFRKGNTYAEFKPGDKIAKYGLAALVTGGAAAVAVKVGLFKKFWKLIIIAFVGIGAAVKKVLNKFRSS